MIPILYSRNETAFSSNGICRLPDIIDGIVTEERNGIYECEFKYPVTGSHFNDIQEGLVIACYHDDTHTIQPFDIYARSEPLNGLVTFYAHHISYRLGKVVLKPFTAGSCLEAFAKIPMYSLGSNPFTFWTDKSVNAEFSVDVPSNLKEMLGGVEGSILDVYGTGEYEWDKYTVKLHLHRGNDNNVTIRYGKNLTKLTHDYDESETYNAAAPFWKSYEGDLVTLSEGYVTASSYSSGDVLEIVPMDLSEKFEEAPTEAQLRSLAQSILDGSDAWVPKDNVTIDFAQLWQSEEFETYASLQRVALCDKVTVINPRINLLKIKMEVIKTQYDFVREKYKSMELGTAKVSFAEAIQASTDQLISDLPDKSFMAAAIEYATNLIKGGLGGHVVLKTNADGEPEEILIMDTDDVSTAVNVWRFNLGGLGHSHSGYDGPFDDVALTMDGRINANMITTGILDAGIIKAGILTDRLGNNWWNLDTGEFHINASTDIRVGGTNLVLGTKDMVSTTGYDSWTLSNMTVSNGVATTGTSSGTFYFFGLTKKQIGEYIGKPITLSADVFIDSLSDIGANLMAVLNLRTTSTVSAFGAGGYKWVNIKSQLVAGKKTRVSVTFYPEADTSYYDNWYSGQTYNDNLYMTFGFYCSSLNTSGTPLQFSRVKAEVGNTDTDWSPAPEDAEYELSDVNTKYSNLSVTVDGIDTEVGSIQSDLTNNYYTKTETNTHISQSASAIELSAKQYTDAVRIGAKNILRGTKSPVIGTTAQGTWANGKFRHSGVANANTVVDMSNTPIPEITKVIKIDSSGGAATTDNFGFVQDKYSMQGHVGETIVFGAWFKGTAGDTVRMQAYWTNTSGEAENSHKDFVLGSSSWEYHSFVTAAIKYNHSAISIGYIYLKPTALGHVLYVCGMMMEYGNKASDWTPAPEDVDSDIAGLETKWSNLSVTVDGINTEVGKKVGNDEIISKINQSAESVTINANKISLVGKTINMTSDNIAINSTNFKVDKNGKVTSSGGSFSFTDDGGNTSYFRVDPNGVGIQDGSYTIYPIQLGGNRGYLSIGYSQLGWVDINAGSYTLRVNDSGIYMYRGNTLMDSWS